MPWPSTAGASSGATCSGRASLGDARQIQRELAAFADLAVHHHLAAGLLCETEHLRQAEPGALADFLGGEERLEDALELVLRNAGAGILDRNSHIAVGAFRMRRRAGNIRNGANRDRQPAFAAHGVAGIDRHVDQRGLELAGVGVDQAGSARHAGDDLDPTRRSASG